MLNTLRNIVGTLLAVLQTRLELIGNELQVQKLVLVRQLGLALALVFCVGLSVPLAIALAVATWWDQRVLVLGISTGVTVAIAIWCYVLLRNTLRSTEVVFAASVAALKDDIALLRASAVAHRGSSGGNVPND